VRLPADGTYTLVANTIGADAAGPYRLVVTTYDGAP
jgi:hypothetical protein